MLPAVLTAALFATSVILGHRAARLAGSLEANFWRVILATIFLALMAFSFGLGLGGGVVGWFALSGAIGVGLGDFAIYHALPLLGPRITSLFVQCFMAVFAALFEWVWLGTTFTWQQGLLSATILAGVLTALGTPGEIREHARTLWPGIVLAVLGAAATAGGAVVSRKAYAVLAQHGTTLDGITSGFQRMIGGLAVSMLLYLVLRTLQHRRDPGAEPRLFAIATPWLWNNFLQPHQRARLTLFLDPNQDPMGGGYHLLQSMVGIGSGGVFGTGLLQGHLTLLRFIPEQHTDFIFSALGEETGFIGSMLVVVGFVVWIWRLLQIAGRARSDVESLVVVGIGAMVMFQVVVNINMTIGLGPITGIPLPWLSYGRSAMLVNFIALGLCASVARRGIQAQKRW